MKRKWEREVLRAATGIGIEDPRIEQRGKHPAVIGTFRGAPFRLSFPSTPSDSSRGLLNLTLQMKRVAAQLVPREPLV